MKYILVINTSVTCVVYVLENYVFWGTNFDIWKTFYSIFIHYMTRRILKLKKKISVLYMQCGVVLLCFISKKKIENIKC